MTYRAGPMMDLVSRKCVRCGKIFTYELKGRPRTTCTTCRRTPYKKL